MKQAQFDSIDEVALDMVAGGGCGYSHCGDSHCGHSRGCDFEVCGVPSAWEIIKQVKYSLASCGGGCGPKGC
jgi:hypothetical protein